MMTMETTTVVPSRFVLRWRLVVAVRCKDPRKLRRRHVRHWWRWLDTWSYDAVFSAFNNAYASVFFPCFVDNLVFEYWLVYVWLQTSCIKSITFSGCFVFKIFIHIWIAQRLLEMEYDSINITWVFIFYVTLDCYNIKDQEFKPLILKCRFHSILL